MPRQTILAERLVPSDGHTCGLCACGERHKNMHIRWLMRCVVLQWIGRRKAKEW